MTSHKRKLPAEGTVNLTIHQTASFALGILLLLCSSARAEDDTDYVLAYAEDFSRGVAEGWDLEAGWDIAIIEDQPALHHNGEGHTHAGRTSEYWADALLRCRVRLEGSAVHLSYRNGDEGRYFLRIDEDATRLNKQLYPDTFFDNIIAGPGMTYGEWHIVEIDGVGDTLTVHIDGQEIFSYTDENFIATGGISLEAFDAEVWVDDFEVHVPASSISPTGPPWIRTGGPLGGLGYDVRIDPDDPDRLFVTDAWAGVFVSNNGGQEWQPSNNGIITTTGASGDGIPVFCLTLDPSNSDTIWIGTQYKRGIFKSTNGGASWTQMNNGVTVENGITFRGFAVDPDNSLIVYAAAELSSWAWHANHEEQPGREFDLTRGVVFRTLNGGTSWEQIWDDDNLARYIWIDPRDTDVIYVSTGIFDREAANSDPYGPDKALAAGGVGIVKSTDGGVHWNYINNGLGNLYVGSLFMHPLDPDTLLAGTGNNQYMDGAGVYITTDGGAHWQQTLSTEFAITSVEYAAADPDTAYAGSSHAVYRSTNGGFNWEQVAGDVRGWGSPGVRAGFPIDFQVHPEQPLTIYANNYGGGNFLSRNGGQTWTVASKGYTGAQIRDIAVDPGASGSVYAAGRSGLFFSANGGEDWIGRNYGENAVLEWGVVAIDPKDYQHILASNNYNRDVSESFDQGRTWRTAVPGPGPKMGFRTVAFAAPPSQTVFAGTGAWQSAGGFDGQLSAAGIYVSHNNGSSFVASNDSTSADAHVFDLEIAPYDETIVYAATSNHGVLVSTNGGQSWNETNQGLPGATVHALTVAIHPTQPGVVFVGLGNAGLHRKPANGSEWSYSGTGMNQQSRVSDIVFDPTDPQTMYATDKFTGVYRSIDGGQSWTAYDNQLEMSDVNALATSADGQHLYAATEGAGVWRLDLNASPPPEGDWPADEIDEPDAEEPGVDEPDEPTEPEPGTPEEPDEPTQDEPDDDGSDTPGDEPADGDAEEPDVEPPEGAEGNGTGIGGLCGAGASTLWACLVLLGTWRIRRRT